MARYVIRFMSTTDFVIGSNEPVKPHHGIVKLNSILPVWVPGRGRASLFLLINRRRARRESKPKIAYTYLP